ncbi:unnamed protein product [Moneuplotes crassus]|uniref:YEATS domain-containing protein n=1 Tax=Euplotes crassus TaxID=5936 RepID=A0AAD2D3L0_EUPCR|nr:unnamed protein product [Moneuplotes crassus]
MCRTVLAGHFVPKVQNEVWDEIKELFPEEVKERIKVVNEIKKKNANMVKITVKYGNTHKLLKKFHTLKSGNANKHRWSCYVRIDDRNIQSEKLIKSVEFELDETFPTNLITRKSAPYEFQMTGWGVFDIPIKITWQHWLKMGPTEVTYPLSFEGTGRQRSFIIKIPKDALAKNTDAKGKLTAIERLIRKRKAI